MVVGHVEAKCVVDSGRMEHGLSTWRWLLVLGGAVIPQGARLNEGLDVLS